MLAAVCSHRASASARRANDAGGRCGTGCSGPSPYPRRRLISTLLPGGRLYPCGFDARHSSRGFVVHQRPKPRAVAMRCSQVRNEQSGKALTGSAPGPHRDVIFCLSYPWAISFLRADHPSHSLSSLRRVPGSSRQSAPAIPNGGQSMADRGTITLPSISRNLRGGTGIDSSRLRPHRCIAYRSCAHVPPSGHESSYEVVTLRA